MNILVIGKFSPDQFAFHIADTLRDMGHHTIEFEPTLPYKYTKTTFGRRLHQVNHAINNNLINTRFFRDRRKNRLANILIHNKIDLTISTHDFLFPDEVMLIKDKSKSRIVLWFPDPVSNFSKSFFIISEYDAVFFKDQYIVDILRTQYNKNNIYYLPECCNPKYHKTVNLSDEDYKHFSSDISTYGNPHNIRSSFFVQLADFNYKIKIWGHEPPIWLTDKKIKSLYTGEYIFDETKSKAVLAAKINLNTLLPSEIQSINARAFEIAGIGGFQIIHRREIMKSLFEEEKELISFTEMADLNDKIKYYLNNDDERNKIAKAGQIKAYASHTYKNRLDIILMRIGDKNGG